MDDIKYRVAFSRIPSIGTVRMRLLEAAFPTIREAWEAPAAALKDAGLTANALQQVTSRRNDMDPDNEMEQLERAGVRAISWHDETYPAVLKEIYDPPPVLFYKGDFTPEDACGVAVVGTRRASAYGREACTQLVRDLAAAGVTIISGLARGIDATAHSTALETDGRTIAVMGTGVDMVYPPEHKRLAARIAENGALVSEYPLGVRPGPRNFPRRNRLLSGLSLGVLVVEAPIDSGVMHTVRFALEQGRDVFAVPGSIFSPTSLGTHRLVQDGAKLVTEAADVLEELNVMRLEQQSPLPGFAPPPAPEGIEADVLQHIGAEPIHIDEVRRQSALPVANVSSTLSLLEIKGLVKQVGGMRYIRVMEPAARHGAAR